MGWYKFKPYSESELTFREKIIHEGLSKLSNIPSDYFVHCISTTDNKLDAATHICSQTFKRLTNIGYENVPLHIGNLSEPLDKYKAPQPISETFQGVLNQLSANDNDSLSIIETIQTSLRTKTSVLFKSLNKLEKDFIKVEEEVRELMAMKLKKNMIEAERERADVSFPLEINEVHQEKRRSKRLNK